MFLRCIAAGVSALAFVVCTPATRLSAQQPEKKAVERSRCVHGEGAGAARGQQEGPERLHPRRDREVRDPRAGRGCGCTGPSATTPGTCATACTSAVPVRFDGVTVGEEARDEYEERWIRRARRRASERKAKEERERDDKEIAISPSGVRRSSDQRVPTEPRFVSEAYFMDFKFEPGQLLPGRAREARRAGRPEDRVLPDEAVRRRRRREDAADDEDGEGNEGGAEGARARAGHRAQDEQDRAGHAVGRSDATTRS